MMADKPVLLPPSSFECTAPVNPWKALAQATGEILDLKNLTSKLRETRHVTLPIGEEIKARVDIHQTKPSLPDQSHLDLSHYHEIINRQAAEISEQRNKLSRIASECETKLARLENRLVLGESKHGHELVIFNEKLGALTKQLDKEKFDFETAKHKWESEREGMTTDFAVRISNQEMQSQENLTGLQQQYDRDQGEWQAKQKEFIDRLKEYQNSNDEQAKTISNMKTYLAKTQDSKSTEIWKKDMENIKHKLKDYEKQNSLLETDSSLLQIRLKSQNDILSLQEVELTKLSENITGNKRKSCILTKWREKVFELLVQNKCSELSQLDSERQLKNRISELVSELDSGKNKYEVIKCSLQDKQAQLDMATNTIQSLQGELLQAQQVAIDLDDRRQTDQRHLQELIEKVNSLSAVVSELTGVHSQTLSTLEAHSQRIAFASSRVELLQGQFARKEAHLRLQLEEAVSEKPTRDTETDPVTTPLCTRVQTELDKVTEERDALAGQIKADAKLLERKVLEAKGQVADEVTLLKNRLEELHTSLQEKTELSETQAAALEQARADLEEAQESVDDLKQQLARCQLQSQQDQEATIRTVQADHTEELAALEHKLNEARREHTKAVVNLRQTERQAQREKDRVADRETTLEQHYKSELARLEEKWRTTDQDRNLLMATLRQEGLISKYKAQRPPPAVSQLDTTDEQLRSPAVYPMSANSTGLESQEPLHVVIDDLRALAETVLADDEDDDDDDYEDDDVDIVEDDLDSVPTNIRSNHLAELVP